MQRALQDLHEDGLEHLGTLTLGTTLVVGDPSQLLGAPGSGAWCGVAVQPGAWVLLGRPFAGDPDLLEELVLVHPTVISAFYDQYDQAVPSASAQLPAGRVALLDGALRTDATLLAELGAVDADALPWVLERGCVAAAIGANPVSVYQTAGGAAQLVGISLGAHQQQAGATSPFAVDDTPT